MPEDSRKWSTAYRYGGLMWTYLPCPSDHPILNDPKISTVAENIEKYTSSDKWSFEFTDIGKVLLYNSVDECLEFKTMAKRVSPESYKSVQMQHVLWKEEHDDKNQIQFLLPTLPKEGDRLVNGAIIVLKYITAVYKGPAEITKDEKFAQFETAAFPHIMKQLMPGDENERNHLASVFPQDRAAKEKPHPPAHFIFPAIKTDTNKILDDLWEKGNAMMGNAFDGLEQAKNFQPGIGFENRFRVGTENQPKTFKALLGSSEGWLVGMCFLEWRGKIGQALRVCGIDFWKDNKGEWHLCFDVDQVPDEEI